MSDHFSIYPGAIDGYAQLPLVIDNVTRVDAVTVNRLRSAIISIETELGIEPSGTYSTVRERLDDLNNDLANRVTLLEQEVLNLLDQIESIGYKNPAIAATTGNIISLSGGAPSTLDGVALSVGDRVLVYKQNNQAENGIYTVSVLGTGSNGTWVRSEDADTSSNLIPGSEIYVVSGTTNGRYKFWLVTPGPYTIGTTPLEFVGGLSVMQSDSSPTQVLAATSITSGSPSTSTNSISVRGFREIDFSFEVSSLGVGPITEIRVSVLYSLLESPGSYATSPEDWNFLLAEDIAGGIGTTNPYQASIIPSVVMDGVPGSFAIRSPIAGLHMQAQIHAQAGDPTSSSFTGYVLRRV